MPRFMPEHRLYANHLAGGDILDVGGYPVSMARLIAGAAAGKPFAEPDKVAGVAHLGRSGVDECASALLQFPGGIVAEVSCSISLEQDNILRILGTAGRIEVIGRDGDVTTIEVPEAGWLYAFEADAAGEAILAGRQELAWPGMGWADSLGNLRVLDKWRASVKLEYAIETPARRATTISGRPLRPGGTVIRKRNIPGLEKLASILALGFEGFRSFASGAILLDAYFEHGGNLFDTAYVYGAGYTESLLGEWLENRCVREQSVIIGKDAHIPLCYPDVIGKQLTQSLDRLRTDHVHVALAYVLAQPFPSVPLIGPRTLGELDDSLLALDVALSPDDLGWPEGRSGQPIGRGTG